jgi:hypothetical protein
VPHDGFLLVLNDGTEGLVSFGRKVRTRAGRSEQTAATALPRPWFRHENNKNWQQTTQRDARNRKRTACAWVL